METSNKRLITIYLEANPNPNSLKFVVNYMLLPEGVSFDFPDSASAVNAPLAQELFKFPYVNRVFYMSNFITVTKEESVEWVEIKEELKNFIKSYLEEEKPILLDGTPAQDASTEFDSDIVVRIKTLLDEYVRPAVEQDGGAITFHSFNNGIVKVILQGSCSGCPSSTVTLKAGIENLLKRMIPEVQGVEA